eukprot:SAG22_NODE_3208_length_1857_cov_1.488623_1_plen_57_part_00
MPRHGALIGIHEASDSSATSSPNGDSATSFLVRIKACGVHHKPTAYTKIFEGTIGT